MNMRMILLSNISNLFRASNRAIVLDDAQWVVGKLLDHSSIAARKIAVLVNTKNCRPE